MIPAKIRKHRRRGISLASRLLVALALAGVVQVLAAAPAAALISWGDEEPGGDGGPGGEGGGYEGGGWGDEGVGWGEEGNWEEEGVGWGEKQEGEEDSPPLAEEEEKRISDEENKAIEEFEVREEVEEIQAKANELAELGKKEEEEEERADAEEPQRVFEEGRRRVEARELECSTLANESSEAMNEGDTRQSERKNSESILCEVRLDGERERLGLPIPEPSGNVENGPVEPKPAQPPGPPAVPQPPTRAKGAGPQAQGPGGTRDAPRSHSASRRARGGFANVGASRSSNGRRLQATTRG